MIEFRPSYWYIGLKLSAREKNLSCNHYANKCNSAPAIIASAHLYQANLYLRTYSRCDCKYISAPAIDGLTHQQSVHLRTYNAMSLCSYSNVSRHMQVHLRTCD